MKGKRFYSRSLLITKRGDISVSILSYVFSGTGIIFSPDVSVVFNGLLLSLYETVDMMTVCDLTEESSLKFPKSLVGQ